MKITVTDPFTGNSCWGSSKLKINLLRVMTCPRSLEISCTESILLMLLRPIVSEYCSACNLTYKMSSLGGCPFGYDKIITRTWTAIDASGNKSTCVQTITVLLGDLGAIPTPPDYTGLALPIIYQHYLALTDMMQAKTSLRTSNLIQLCG
ncbi:MAG: hypothetical protein IPI30_06190 [Saprospiraceae bacterium]|nr:hypothetical protein [Candidatus Vicinibacter affinis]